MAEPKTAGGVRSKGGRPPLPLRLRRNHTYRVSFAVDDAADIERVAAAWGVPPGVALWAIMKDQLARWRKREPQYGKHGLAIAGALQVLRQKSAEERAEAKGGSSEAE